VIARGSAESQRTETQVDDRHVPDFKGMVERIPAVVYLAEAGESGRWLYVSPAIEKILGYRAEEWMTDPLLWAKRLHPDDRERVLAEESMHLGSALKTAVTSDYRLIASDGSVVWVRDRAVAVEEPDRPPFYQGLLVEIGEQKAAEEELQSNERRFRSLLENATDLVGVLDSIATLRYVSPSVRSILGYEPKDIVGRSVFDLIHPDDAQMALERFVNLVSSDNREARREVRVRHVDGSVRWMEVNAINLLNDADVRGIVLNARETTEQRALEERLRHLAYHDSLTGLPNRTLFMDRVARSLSRLSRREHSIALMFLDLDDFKDINDRLGHRIGDEVLGHVAANLVVSLRPSDSAARLGGDEFGVLLDDLGGPEDAEKVAGRIFDQLAQPLTVRGHEITVVTSAGIAIGDTASLSADALLHAADEAMYKAKAQGKNRWQFA
jgi:diguanylate cyclase (GGDEF)-like protein/PAS domain S-box-containing protein